MWIWYLQTILYLGTYWKIGFQNLYHPCNTEYLVKFWSNLATSPKDSSNTRIENSGIVPLTRRNHKSKKSHSLIDTNRWNKRRKCMEKLTMKTFVKHSETSNIMLRNKLERCLTSQDQYSWHLGSIFFLYIIKVARRSFSWCITTIFHTGTNGWGNGLNTRRHHEWQREPTLETSQATAVM